MIRALTILAAIAALAVTAGPASASQEIAVESLTTLKARGAGVIESVGVKYTASARKRPSATITPSGGELLGNDWVKAPPRSTAIHQNEGIDGGFRTKSRLKAAHTQPRATLLHGDFATFGVSGKAKAPRSASAFTSQTSPHADGLIIDLGDVLYAVGGKSRLKAAPKPPGAIITRAGGEVFTENPKAYKTKAPRRGASLQGVVDVIERDEGFRVSH